MWRYEPDFGQILKALEHKKPDRPVMYELFLNSYFYEYFAGYSLDMSDPYSYLKMMIDAYANAGYDYTAINASQFEFPKAPKESKETTSLNGPSMIFDRASFDKYPWPDPENFDYARLEKLVPYMPEGMKFVINGPCGVLENTIQIVGYDNLCLMIYDDEELVQEIFDNVGNRLLKYYEIALQYDSVGMIMLNDDWGFNTQTFLSPDQMRKYVFPWHKKMVAAAHQAGKPAVLHSCGNPRDIMEDIIEDMKFDGRHSYEDSIIPVEDFYKKWSGRITVMGGMDMDFMTRSSEAEVRKRVRNMLELSEMNGSYMLGTGNSIADFIPHENYLAMIDEANKLR